MTFTNDITASYMWRKNNFLRIMPVYTTVLKKLQQPHVIILICPSGTHISKIEFCPASATQTYSLPKPCFKLTISFRRDDRLHLSYFQVNLIFLVKLHTKILVVVAVTAKAGNVNITVDQTGWCSALPQTSR